MKTPMTKLMLAAAAATLLCLGAKADGDGILLSENFDGETIDSRISFASVGTFNDAPGIKAEMGVDGSKAYGFGRSTCGSSAFDNYMTTLTITFDEPKFVSRIVFDEMERYGDWGTQGRLLVDGTNYAGVVFCKEGNTQIADTTWRQREFELDITATTISLQCHDITSSSEEFIDNLAIYGEDLPKCTVIWQDEDGTVFYVKDDVLVGYEPRYPGILPRKEGFVFTGWDGDDIITSNAVLTAQWEPFDDYYADYVKVGTAEELNNIRNNLTTNYVLTADIDLDGVAWTRMSTFKGILDGNGHEIRNISISATATDDVAFFYSLQNATVRNLTLRGGKIEGRHRVAGIAARLHGGSLIENCTVDLEITAYGDSAAGIACWQENNTDDRIVRTRSLSAVTSYAAIDRVAGICSCSRGTLLIEDCYATGSATGFGTEGSVGGLVAYRESNGVVTFSNCYHRVRRQGSYISGADIAGYGDESAYAKIYGKPKVLDCFPKNVVNVRTRGNGTGTASYNPATGEFTATPDEGSAFVRWEGLPPKDGDFNETTAWAVFGKAVATEADLRDVTAKGFFVQTADIEMTTSDFIGLHYNPMFQGEYDGCGYAIRNLTIAASGNEGVGLFRRTQGAILKNIHLVGGRVRGGAHVGALVGDQYAGIIEDCSSSCNVVATGNHGGGLVSIAVANYSTIRRCSASGSVTVYGSYAGGLVSYTNGGETKIYDSYATGDVTANDYAGGFMSHGDNVFAIRNCYSTGRVKCATLVGGFMGRRDTGKTIVNCFWDVETSGQSGSIQGSTGKTTAEMKTASTYESWDGEIWNITDGAYPTLKEMPEPQVAAMKSGVGGGEVTATDNGDGTYTITATPDENSFFVEWSGTGVADATSATTTIRVDDNTGVTAVFGTLIRTADELKAALSGIDGYGHYKLANDIDLENTSARATGQFNGVFDGDGHAIRNIKIALTTTDDVGLFSFLRDATIKNLSIRGGKIEGRHRVAGIVGRMYSGNLIENCTTDLEIVAHGYEAGGIFGYADNSTRNTIIRCRSLCAVAAYNGSDCVGGIGGKTDNDTVISECYATGSVTGFGTAGHVGGMVGSRNNGAMPVFSNCYHRVRRQGSYIANSEMFGVGDASATIIGKPTILDCFPKNIVNVRTRGNGTGTARYENGEFIAEADEGSAFVRWEGLPPEDGDFNETTAWAVFGKAVATEADLRAVTAKGFFVQTADIEMTTSPAFTGLHNDPLFQGEYDGQGHAIRNLTINASGNDNTALFRRTQGAILKNIHLVGGLVRGHTYVAPLVGYQYAGIIEDCSSSCNVTATENHCGGLVGRADDDATIRRCATSGSVTCYGNYAGGLVSYVYGYYGRVNIYDSYAWGDVSANDYAGGFMSHADYATTVSNCYSTGLVKSPTNVGGFMGRRDTDKTIVSCFWDVETSGQTGSIQGSTGKTTAEIKTASTYAAWDGEVWSITDGAYPTLKGAPAPQVAAMKSGVGGGDVTATDNGDGTYTITATPDESSFFVKWSGTGIADAASATTTVRADGNTGVTAVFGTLIHSADELKAALSGIDRYGHYKLANDIDLENTSARATAQFNGVFDGDGHAIRNIKIALTTTDDVGLFSFLRDATIKNLSIRGGKIEGRHRVAGIVGRMYSGNIIENCTTDLEIVAHGYEAGGIFGYADNSTRNMIIRCRSLCAVTAYNGSDCVGGIGGKTDNDTVISECYATGSVTGFGTAGHVGGMVGSRNNGAMPVFSNCYHRVRRQGNYIANSEMFGVGDSNAKIYGSPEILDCFPKNIVNVRVRGNGTGTARYENGEFIAEPDEGSAFVRWEGLPPEEGDYNETTAWAVFGKAVATETDLRAVKEKGFYVQTAEIDMAASDFIGLHYDPLFQGEYDGQGYGIYNLTISGNNDYAALFRRTHGAILRNIHLVGGTVNGRSYVAPLVGYQYAGLVEGCFASVDALGTGDFAAGLVARSDDDAVIRTSAAMGSVSTGRYAGGLVSYAYGYYGRVCIVNCFARGNVTAGSYAGGFMSHGDYALTVKSCYSTGIVASGSYAGGFMGRLDTDKTILGCFYDAETSGQTSSIQDSVGKTTEQMQTAATFSTWDGYEWLIADGAYPELIALKKADKTFTVTWLDEDGTVLRVDENVQIGRTPVYRGAKPTKVPDGEGVGSTNYVFSGWYPSPTPIVRDMTFSPVFKSVITPGMYENSKWTLEEDGAWRSNGENPIWLTAYERGTFIFDVALSCAQFTGTYGSNQNNYGKGSLIRCDDGEFLSGVYAPAFDMREQGSWYPQSKVVSDGEHVVRWYYDSNGSYASNRRNCAWIRNIVWRPEGYVFTNTVTWVNVDGTVLKTDRVVEGETPVYDGATPTIAPDGDYSFTFAGWTPAVKEMPLGPGDITYTATYSYSNTKRTAFTVTWQDADGTVLEIDENVGEGRTPKYDGLVPKKAAAGGTFYSFAGWSPEVAPVAGDVTYTATYRAATRKTWMDIDLRTGAVGYYDLDFAAATNKFNTEEYKTVKMAFRRVEKGDDYFVQNGAYTANFTNSYYIGMFEVTVAQYALMQNPSAYVGTDVSFLRSQGYCSRSGVRGMADAPTAFGEGITAASPLGRLNALVQAANEDARLVFDLPTEAMWEVAARAVESGDDSRKGWKYFFGNDDSELPQYAFYASMSEADAYGITSAMRVPGCKLPNAWGLYDMYGNARDVCLDVHTGATDNWSLAPYYGGNWQRDRGGAYNDAIGNCNSSSRSCHDSGGYDHNGIRLSMICSDDDEIVRTTHTVRWRNWDGTLLQEDEVVDGGYVRYRGANPTRSRQGVKTYLFRGWAPVVSPVVTIDVTYTAAYEMLNVLLPDDYVTEGWIFDETELTLKSKAIGHSSSTTVHLDVTGPGSLVFKWKVSSEAGYDWLRFYRNGAQLAQIGGYPDWATISNRVDEAGAVTFSWTYVKDGSESKGSDCGWIKDIIWIPDAAGTQVFVGGESAEFNHGADGRTLTATVPAGTLASEVQVKVDGIDVSKGFARSIEGTVFTATLLAPYEVPKETGASNDIWTENGDGTVTLNVTVVPGLYYAAASSASLDAFKCPGASSPATSETTLTAPKPVGGTGFFKVWVSDAPIAAEP